jgi:hypothetical protein
MEVLPPPSFAPSALLRRRAAADDGAADTVPRTRGTLPPRVPLTFRPLSPILSPSLFAASPEEGDEVDYVALRRRPPTTRRLSLPLEALIAPAATDDAHAYAVPAQIADSHASHSLYDDNANIPTREPSMTRRPPLFHIPTGTASDGEDDDGPSPTPSRRPSVPDLDAITPIDEPLPEQTSEPERRHVRQFHALMELLTTEAAYLTDLRILVSVRCSLIFFRTSA